MQKFAEYLVLLYIENLKYLVAQNSKQIIINIP